MAAFDIQVFNAIREMADFLCRTMIEQMMDSGRQIISLCMGTHQIVEMIQAAFLRQTVVAVTDQEIVATLSDKDVVAGSPDQQIVLVTGCIGTGKGVGKIRMSHQELMDACQTAYIATRSRHS